METPPCKPPCLTFAAFRSEPKVVGLTALTVLTGDARLALTLTSADVTLPIGGTQSMAVTPERDTRLSKVRRADCTQHSLLKAPW